MTNRTNSIVVLRAFNNRLATHIEMLDEVKKVLSNIEKGEIVEVFHPNLKEKIKE